MTIELASDTTDRSFGASTRLVAEHSGTLDSLVERLVSLGSLTLEQSRRAAFAVIGEDIYDHYTREILRNMYAPSLGNVTKKLLILDGGLGVTHEL